METIKVTKKHQATQITIKTSHRKEKHFSKGLTTLGIQEGEIRELIATRIYWTKGGTCTACVWLHSMTHDSASGKSPANSGGYCKESSAVAEALVNLGFEFNERISGGVGMRTIEEALNAVAQYISGAKAVKTIIQHG
jgi:hypothetical protein